MSFILTKDDKAEMKVNGCISELSTMKIALRSSKLWNEFHLLITEQIKQACGIRFYSVYCGDAGSDVDVGTFLFKTKCS